MERKKNALARKILKIHLTWEKVFKKRKREMCRKLNEYRGQKANGRNQAKEKTVCYLGHIGPTR